MTAPAQSHLPYVAQPDRRDFLKHLGGLAVVAVAAPRLRRVSAGATLASPVNEETTTVSWQDLADPGWSY